MLKNEGGSIVNVASISGLRASTLRIAYGTNDIDASNQTTGC